MQNEKYANESNGKNTKKDQGSEKSAKEFWYHTFQSI